MTKVNVFALSAFTVVLAGAPCVARAQITVNIGHSPVCPYGYFDYEPYSCAPYGYYGPDWFNRGLFVGAGPWFRGRRGFYGHVDNRYDPRHGYAGPMPKRGDQPFSHFQGNEARDGQGHSGNAGHEPGEEHKGGFQGRGRHGGEDDHSGNNGRHRGEDDHSDGGGHP